MFLSVYICIPSLIPVFWYNFKRHCIIYIICTISLIPVFWYNFKKTILLTLLSLKYIIYQLTFRFNLYCGYSQMQLPMYHSILEDVIMIVLTYSHILLCVIKNETFNVPEYIEGCHSVMSSPVPSLGKSSPVP